jgi:hypothetical protein
MNSGGRSGVNEMDDRARACYDRRSMLGIDILAQGRHRTPFQIALVRPHNSFLRLFNNGGTRGWRRIFADFWTIDLKVAHHQLLWREIAP